ncbi:FAD/NAD(P)-dependent oxidoreductase [Nonomuraea sediminis]|uniref:FAD/NAD(P)-dependent oxidoreductase n=1 Tax=Nonomuraea sediminis TaxID=2835864 RepID=UPI001BDBBDF1|nr:NAD(P)/FAD-dependent oxidoreductase [Nonomuraea sediminis]
MTYDLIVVGGGPAGVAGALAAAQSGLRVALLDLGARLGGQYFRHAPDGVRGADPGPQAGLARFLRQAAAVGELADVRLGHQVWSVAKGETFAVHATHQDEPVTLHARHLLIATGAHDRPLPFPGWDLPGVLTAGGAQALLKGNHVIAGRRVVVGGTGPFLLPVAAGLAQAGADVAAVLEAGSRVGLGRHPLLAMGKAGEAAGYALTLARHRVPYHGRQAVVAAHGRDELTHVTVGRLDRDWRVRETRTIACDTLAVSYGFVPQLDLAVQLGCATRADLDGTQVVAVDARQRTSVPGVWAAGEPTGVGGAPLAELEGRIAGLAVAAALTAASRHAAASHEGALDGPAVPDVLVRRRARSRAFARALLKAYPVRPGWQEWLAADTLVCRCEEVPLSAVREAQALGATDARSVKLLARPGMGWCQGRMCGYAVSCLTGEAPEAPRRPVVQPITLGALERIDDDESR